MAPPADFRSWLEVLDREGELVRIEAEVDPYLEITEIADRTVKAGGPALLFQNVKGAEHPLLINQFGSERRMCLAFDVPSLDALADRFNAARRALSPPVLAQLARSADGHGAAGVGEAPAQEVVLAGEDVDLDRLPIQHCWPGDPAPFITLPAVITRDPRTGTRNVGIYRMQKLDARTTAMHWQLHKDAAADWRAMGERLDVAVALGLDPVTVYTASAAMPKDLDEFFVAALLRGGALELVKGKTIDLDVPANAEIVLEGYIAKGELATEGPFGDHTGYYSPPEPFPVFHLTAMTLRRDAIYPSIVVGKPPQEDGWLGKASERIGLAGLRAALPEVVDYDLPVAGAFLNCVIVSIRKAYPGHAKKVMYALWGTSLGLAKSVVVLDEWVDVHDYEEVFFRVCANVDPKRDAVIVEGPLDHLDHAPTLQFLGGKLGIDATHKGPDEGARPWPDEIVMTDEIRELVDRRWSEYGLGVS